MKRYTLLLLTAISFTACSEETIPDEDRMLSIENIPTQSFTLNAQHDTIIKGQHGTTLKIFGNSFVGRDGKPVIGTIEFTLKEANTPGLIAMSGLTTTSDGKILQTGGMIYTNAMANGDTVQLAEKAFVGVVMPTFNFKKEMSLFMGEVDSEGINWTMPTPTLNDKIAAIAAEPKALPQKAGKGDSVNEIDAVIEYVNSDTATTPDNNRNNNTQADQNLLPTEELFLGEVKGVNYHHTDLNASYIFTLKKLGWANIDIFLSDERSREVQFITRITNARDFSPKSLSITLMTNYCYIPGYQKKDNTYGFTHGDDEKPNLPVGEAATILVTARKGGKLYYAIKEITISEKQDVSLTLKETTRENLESALL